MADGVVVRTNIPDFKRQLDAFGLDFTRKTVRSATSAAAGIFKKAVIALVPVLRPRIGRAGPSNRQGKRVAGVLRRSIYVARSRQSTTGAERYVVSFRKQKRSGGDPFYGKFLEGGWIPRGPGKKLRGGAHSKALQRSRLSGQKITKYAFLAPGFRNAGTTPLDKFTERIQARLDKENKK